MKKKETTFSHTSTTAHGILTDEVTGKKLNASVGFDCGKICINIEGYGDALSIENQGQPVVVDLFDNKLQVIVWGDINQEDPTHKIDLEGAREIFRKEQ